MSEKNLSGAEHDRRGNEHDHRGNDDDNQKIGPKSGLASVYLGCNAAGPHGTACAAGVSSSDGNSLMGPSTDRSIASKQLGKSSDRRFGIAVLAAWRRRDFGAGADYWQPRREQQNIFRAARCVRAGMISPGTGRRSIYRRSVQCFVAGISKVGRISQCSTMPSSF
jgi:hypothetical protein